MVPSRSRLGALCGTFTAIVSVTAVLGCTGTTSPSARAEFIKRADTVCKRYATLGNQAINQMVKGFHKAKTQKEFRQAEAEGFGRMASVSRRITGELHALKPPRDVEQYWHGFLVYIDANDRSLSVSAKRTQKGLYSLPAGPKEPKMAPAALRFLKTYGFKFCSQAASKGAGLRKP